MSEVGSFESFDGGPQAGEASEQSQEQFRDEQKRSQAQAKALKQEEGKAQGQDNNLAQIIVQFLNQPENTDLFLLISRCFGQNITSELILAVLSLIDARSHQETDKLLAGNDPAHHEKALAVMKEGHFNTLSPQHKQAIDKWISGIYKVASNRPQRSLDGLIVHKPAGEDKVIREIAPSFVQLSAFIMRRFFESQNINFEYEELSAFMQNAYVKLVRHLEELIEGQKKLS